MRERIDRAYDVRGIFTMLALAAAYMVAAKVGLAFSLFHKSVSPVWPASGLALAGLLWFGVRRWPGVFLGSFLATLLWHAPLLASLEVSVGTTLEAVLGAWLLKRLGFSRTLERVQDVVSLILGAAAGCSLVSALIGSSSLASMGILPWKDFVKGVWVWWGGDAMGVVVVTPVLLLIWPPRPVERRVEALALAGCTLLVCLGLFTAALVGPFSWYIGTFFFFPLATWAALRFGPRGVALVTLFLTVFSLWGAMARLGHPQLESESQYIAQTLLLWQLFIGVGATTCLLLAAASAGRRDATKRVELLATAMRGVSEGVVISSLSPSGPKVVFANEAFRSMVGIGLVELMGCSPVELAGEMDPETRQRLDAALHGAEPFQGQVSLRHRNGSRLHSEMQLSAVRDPQGGVTHLVFTYRDVTATQELRARLMAAERVAAVGTLAAGVGHEIQNPLAYLELNLGGAVRSLLRGRGSVTDALTQLREAQEGAERIRLIVQDLRMFSREGAQDRQPVDLREVATPALRMVRHVLRNRARLVEDYESIPLVLASEARLGQVLLNLLVNAVQAIPEGEPEEHMVRIHTCTAPDGRAQIEVWDTGRGIHPEVLPHIFEPFFTTKSFEEGTGLGLSICQQIVRVHGGEILVSSEPGNGSVFTVLLPAAPEGAIREAPRSLAEDPSSNPHTLSRRGRVLIVDDEPRLAQSMRLLLEPAYEVVIATGGREALEMVASGQRIDVVVCDLQMPGTTGMDLYEQLLEQAPDLAERLVFMSGGAYTPAATHFVRTVRNRVLEKPVPPEQLRSAIAAAVAPSLAHTSS
ncbi:MASE1 domain-containing protein [Hyalangium versicolor]|uniref:MASE1 domain-containing protein n=1 Tax=Hyalangium versicolor TaxID=2861190 RepID=UPI001CCD917A|nr:MASE1 domain-containing protein [Hyalangium versicolor]